MIRGLAAVVLLMVAAACDGGQDSSPHDLGLDKAEAGALLGRDLAARDHASFSVKYAFRVEENVASVMWHRGPNGNSRFDVGEGNEMISAFRLDGADSWTICAEEARFVLNPVPTSVTGGACSVDPTADDDWWIILLPLIDDDRAVLGELPPVVRATERDIAGQRARCYKFGPPIDTTNCFAGGALLAVFAEGESTSIEAVDVRMPVDESALELPYPLVETAE